MGGCVCGDGGQEPMFQKVGTLPTSLFTEPSPGFPSPEVHSLRLCQGKALLGGWAGEGADSKERKDASLLLVRTPLRLCIQIDYCRGEECLN